MQRFCLILVMMFITGCSTGSVLKGALSSVTGGGPRASLDVQVGDKEVARGSTIASATSKQETKVETVAAQREIKLDQSSKKKDQKTEIGEVKGNVNVQQGPNAFTLALLSSGWFFLVILLVAVLYRRVKNGRNPGEAT